MSILDFEEVNHSLLFTLKEAENRRWTGLLKVLKDPDQIGLVVMHEGKMAWASSTRQTENFGSFLEKIGMIPKGRQKEIIDQFRTLGKAKELGALLEEAGLLSRSTLRKCLEKQIQEAVNCLLEIENIEIKRMECKINVYADLLFQLNEVLPDKFKSEHSDGLSTFDGTDFADSENGKDTNCLGNVLKNFVSLAGYQYSFIYDQENKILASHKSDAFPGNLEEIITSSLSCIISTNTSLKDSRIGRIASVLLEHDEGSLVAQWPYFERNFFVAASFDKNGKPGVIRHKISDMIPSILRITGESH